MEYQENNTPLWLHALKFGIIYAAAIIIFDLVFFIAGVNRGDHPLIDSVVLLTSSVTTLYFGMKIRRDQQVNGYSKYTEVLKTALFIGVMASVILAAWKFLFYKFINPEELLKEFETAKKAILEMDYFDEDKKMEIISAMKDKNSAESKISGQLFGVNFYVLIVSLIIAIFVQKRDPEDTYKSLDM
ncbi:MAG: DUF4199 domain-containing protein [Bacteroidia bacterium]|nr:DUF4199 domain-containing protein [Bacteroidia bacterium]